jgi:hypothetical protein
MKIYGRICLHDVAVPNGDETFWLKRGQIYTTSAENNGKVCVFTRYWFWWDASAFGGAEPLSRPDLHSS